MEKLPPHSLESEQGVLGCILQDPMDAMNECAQKLVCSGDEFYDLRHQFIYKTVIAMWRERLPIDLITVQTRLKARKRLDQVGGVEYLNKLQDGVPSAANLPTYLEEVIRKSMLRELLVTGNRIAAMSNQDDAQKALGDAEMAILAIRQKREGGRGLADIGALQDALISEYELAASNQQKMGLPTGFQELDDTMGGMMEQEVVILAGSPSSGKTSIMLNILFNIAEKGTPVGILSMETSAKKLIHRLHCMAGQVEGGLFFRGAATEADMAKMVAATTRVRKVRPQIHLRDDIVDGTALIAACRQMYQSGVRIFGIDYLQLIRGLGGTEYEQVTQASKIVKGIAKELNVPVILISSLNRGDKDASKKPSMSDLRGSGNIEFDADKILLLHCENRDESVRAVEVNIAKNKDGGCGRKELTLFAPQFRFVSSAKIQPRDIPQNYVDTDIRYD